MSGRIVRGPATLAALLLPSLAAAQAPREPRSRTQAEARIDVVVARATAAHVGVGGNVALGTYLRTGLTVAGGAVRGRDGDPRASGRVDLVGRFLLDPYREHRWGPYAGAGIGARWDEGARWREAVLLVIGVEGSAARSTRTAVEIGFGGGTRIGLVLRRGRSGAR